MKYVLVLILLLGCSSNPESVATDPVATFGASTTVGGPPLTVVLDGSGSSNAAGFVWNLGDDTVARGARVTHTFSEVGAYEVRLWVTGEDGALSAPASRVINVREDQPTPPPPTPEPHTNLVYAGQWAWLAEFDNGIIFRGVATINEAVSEPDFGVAEAGTWRQCDSANECPSAPDGAALIGETVLAGEVSLVVTFEGGSGQNVLLAVDNDGALGSELGEETFFGRGIWAFADGREEAVNFVMTRSQ